jgi:simple sugar transport system ATP-binding protein
MLFRQANILILDEPTAVLTPQEAEHLFETVRQMTSEGHGVVFISHKMDEVMGLSQRVTILRKGKLVGTVETASTSKEQLAR